MHSRVPRATRVYAADRLPADRTPDRPAAQRMSKEYGGSYTRPRHLTAEEQAVKDDERADAHRNLAAMCFEQAGGIDLRKPVDEQNVPHGWMRSPTTAGTVAGARDFLLLADILGLDGAR